MINSDINLINWWGLGVLHLWQLLKVNPGQATQTCIKCCTPWISKMESMKLFFIDFAWSTETVRWKLWKELSFSKHVRFKKAGLSSRSPHFTSAYPLTSGVVGALQMTSQPVSSIFLCSPLLSGTWQTPGLSVPWCCVHTSSSLCLVFFPLFTVPCKMVLVRPDERET